MEEEEEEDTARMLHAACPSTQWIAVNVPGYVRDVPKALRMLGGTAKLASTFSSSGQAGILEFRFHPDNLLSHPLTATAGSSPRGLVLRISRPRGAGEEVQPKVQVVAQVASTYRFSSLADYQFLPVDPGRSMRYHAPLHSALLPIPSENLANEAEPSGLAESMLLVPPTFASNEELGTYSFRQYLAPAPGTKGKSGPVLIQRGMAGARSTQISFFPARSPCSLACTCRRGKCPGSGLPHSLGSAATP
jgi:hypothetical protein